MIDKKILEKTQLQRMTCGLTWLFLGVHKRRPHLLGGEGGSKIYDTC